MLGDVEPDCVVVECVFVGIEALERVLVARVVTVHGGVVLVAEDYPRAGDAFSGGFDALSTHGLLLITLQLALTTSEAGSRVRRLEGKVSKRGSPSCS
jgi:hypothetical protein